MRREPILEPQRDVALRKLKASLEDRIREKGVGAFVSIHEMRGVISEEYEELMAAMHSKNHVEIKSELLDLAVAAIFSYACFGAT